MNNVVELFRFSLLLTLACCLSCNFTAHVNASDANPNILFLLTDDQRADGYRAAGNELLQTPNLDRIAARGTRFTNAFVTLAICSPSRAACLTGRYGSANGVTSVGREKLNADEPSFARALRTAGYLTGVTGKWHLKTTPLEAGFDFASTCFSNGTWYERQFTVEGEKKVMPGFVDDVTADESIRFMKQAKQSGKPFVLWMNTQVPHMDHKFSWPAAEKYLQQYNPDTISLPQTWNDNLFGKPEYLKTSRNRTRALEYGYDNPEAIRNHTRDYYAGVQQMDSAIGGVLDELDELKLSDNTWVIFMGDNGWMLGEHGMTSKVLPYEESMHVPMAIAPPKVVATIRRDESLPLTSERANTVAQDTMQTGGVCDELVLNIDLTATIYDIAGLTLPASLHGRSLLPILSGKTPRDWRTSFLYEAPTPQLGSQPLWAVRSKRWKYVETQVGDNRTFQELYNLQSDAIEIDNLAQQLSHKPIVARMVQQLRSHRAAITVNAPLASITAVSQSKRPSSAKPATKAGNSHRIPATPPPAPRTDLHISGVYPHLTTYGVYSQNGAHFKEGHNECGIGAIVPWAGKLWMVNYAPHMPKGSEHKLFSVDSDLTQPITVHPESVGGTPAGRMIHAESNQLLIAHHLIDAEGNVRTILPKDMPIRVTAIARHLKDPANMVYYIDMEGSIWEANVNTLAVKRLFKKPVPGWHGKGGYTSQGRLVISNNGELHVGDYKDVLVGGSATNAEERGVLAEYDGTNWKIVERRQFTEVTGPSGITGGSDGNDPVWTMGWDRRSVRLKVLDDGYWHTYLLPKAAFCNDASHGWYTEWPRIREITNGRTMMDMHGMFFDFPKTFSAKNSAGIRPIGSHLRYVPDFCNWNGNLVLASDETSIQGNRLAGQPQSNLWFGSYEDLKTWGPSSGYGGPWISDTVQANEPSDPFLVSGFDKRVLHMATGQKMAIGGEFGLRTTDKFEVNELPDLLTRLPRITVGRGDWHDPSPGYSFTVDQPVTVYLSVDGRGTPKMPAGWNRTKMTLTWGGSYRDTIYTQDFPQGKVNIPAADRKHSDIAYEMPFTAFVRSQDTPATIVMDSKHAKLTLPAAAELTENHPVEFTVQIDANGNDQWTDYQAFTVPADGYVTHIFPDDFNAIWMRVKTDSVCVATAVLHQTTKARPSPTAADKQLFAGLASLDEQDVRSAQMYPAKRNRNLRIITGEDRFLEFTKADFEFTTAEPDPRLRKLVHVDPEFTVDEASVILKHRGRNLRLPKGSAAFDVPFASGWPRASREVQSERHLANIHGTFYEVPLVTNGAPPAWHQVRPVSSHNKQITDFCSWNGLLVLAGIRHDATNDGHVFADPSNDAAMWFGGIDDLWKLGKPIGHGGPWKNTAVVAGQPSDPYLMTGYDRKTLSLTADADTVITIEVDIDHQSGWHSFRNIKVTDGHVVEYEFPAGFSAHWIRFRSSADCTATAQLTYE